MFAISTSAFGSVFFFFLRDEEVMGKTLKQLFITAIKILVHYCGEINRFNRKFAYAFLFY